MNRPAAFLCLVFSAGMAAGLFLGFWHIVGIALTVALVALIIKSKRKAAMVAWLSVAFLLAGVAYAKLYAFIAAPSTPNKYQEYSFTAAVRDIKYYPQYSKAEIEVLDKQSPFNGCIASLNVYTPIPKAGEVIQVTGKLAASKAYDKANGVDYIVNGSYTPQPNAKARGVFYTLQGLRRWVNTAVDAHYGDDAAPFYRAMITGERGGLSTELNASFSRSGISHILAISGQHFSLIIISIYHWLLLITKHKKLCCGISLLLAVTYTLFTGGSPSIIRAAFMCCAIFAADLFNRKGDALINLCVALVVILLFNPYAVLNISLQLSFLASMGLVFVSNHLSLFYERHNIRKKAQAVITPVALSVTASLFCTPVFFSSFDYISVIAPITNALINILVGPALIMGILLLPLSSVVAEAAFIPKLLFYTIQGLSDAMAGIKYACVSVHVPYIKLLLVPSLGCLLAFAVFRLRRGVRVLCIAAFATIVITVGCLYLQNQSHSTNTVLHIQDTGRNAYLFYADGTSAVLVDGMGAYNASAGVLEQGYTYLDAYVITCCTEDSVTRLAQTLCYTPTKTLYLPQTDTDYTQKALRIAADKGCSVKRYSDNRLEIGTMDINTPTEDYENGGYIIRLEKGNTDLCVFGGGEGVRIQPVEKCTCLVLTRALEEKLLDYKYLPTVCDTVFAYDGENSYSGLYIKRYAKYRCFETYKGNLTLRIGRDGVVKE